MHRVVLDTNVLVSAIISNGKSRELLKRGISKQYSIIISDLILKELITVLNRPKFKTNKEEVSRTIFALSRTVDFINVTSKIKVIKEDTKDDMIIETTVDGGAGSYYFLGNPELKANSIHTRIGTRIGYVSLGVLQTLKAPSRRFRIYCALSLIKKAEA